MIGGAGWQTGSGVSNKQRKSARKSSAKKTRLNDSVPRIVIDRRAARCSACRGTWQNKFAVASRSTAKQADLFKRRVSGQNHPWSSSNYQKKKPEKRKE